MNKIIPVLFILIPNLVTAQIFNVRTSEIETDTAVIAAAEFKQQIFCLQEDRTLLRIDTTKMEVYRQPITVHTLRHLYSQRDTLFGVAGPDSLYHFNGDDFQYTGRKKDGALYTDVDYRVMSTCSGEFGGSIYFINRKTGKTYVCQATCPVMVNKTDIGYIVTVSLAHLSGSTEILEIRSPDQMQIYKYKPPKRRVIYVGENESLSRQGVKVLADSTGLFTIGSYPIEGEILHVVTDFRRTYICQIRNGSFETIQQLADRSFWSYRRVSWSNDDGVGFSFFLNHEHNGIMRIAGKNVQIYLFRYKSSN